MVALIVGGCRACGPDDIDLSVGAFQYLNKGTEAQEITVDW